MARTFVKLHIVMSGSNRYFRQFFRETCQTRLFIINEVGRNTLIQNNLCLESPVFVISFLLLDGGYSPHWYVLAGVSGEWEWVMVSDVEGYLVEARAE